MGFVQISDPNIVDLTAIHNIINVVNQHSNALSQLTNSTGAANNSTVSWGGTDVQAEFTPASQNIVFGRASFTSAISPTSLNTSVSAFGNYKLYTKQVTFAGQNGIAAFSTYTPFVLLTVNTGNTSGSVSQSFPDAIAHAYNVSSTGFSIRLLLNTAMTSGQAVYVNWMAIGPK